MVGAKTAALEEETGFALTAQLHQEWAGNLPPQSFLVWLCTTQNKACHLWSILAWDVQILTWHILAASFIVFILIQLFGEHHLFISYFLNCRSTHTLPKKKSFPILVSQFRTHHNSCTCLNKTEKSWKFKTMRKLVKCKAENIINKIKMNKRCKSQLNINICIFETT